MTGFISRLMRLQIVRYGVVGVASTLVQLGVFYLLASTVLKCLGSDDVMVRCLSLPAVSVADGVRAYRAAAAQMAGFTVANVFCWLMSRRYVFVPGRHRWPVELALFFAVSLAAFVAGVALQSLAISCLGWQTTYASLLEVVSAFVINFLIRKFYVFKK